RGGCGDNGGGVDLVDQWWGVAKMVSVGDGGVGSGGGDDCGCEGGDGDDLGAVVPR
ncbi:hypothetical protein Tco_1350049, partial [Tanacetum coccineum]